MKVAEIISMIVSERSDHPATIPSNELIISKSDIAKLAMMEEFYKIVSGERNESKIS